MDEGKDSNSETTGLAEMLDGWAAGLFGVVLGKVFLAEREVSPAVREDFV